MLRILIILVLVIGSMSLSGQFTYFNNRYNNDYWSAALSIQVSDEGYVVCGVSGEVSNGYLFRRIVLTAIDDQGNQVWWKTYGEDFHDYYAGFMRGFISTSDNGYAVSGSVEDTIRDVGLLMKFDHNGDSLWSRIYGDTVSPGYSGTKFHVCVQLPDNGYLITGGIYVSGDDGDIILLRTDSLGNTIWSQSYGTLHWVETGYSIAQLPDGEFLIGTRKQYIVTNNTLSDAGLLKVDSLGNQIWLRYYGGPYDDGTSQVVLSQDGNYLIGSTYAVDQIHADYPKHKVWIFKTDTSGNVLWERLYSDKTFLGWCSTIDELDDESIIVSGSGGFEGTPGTVGWILKTDQYGDSIWMRRYNYYPAYVNHLNDLRLTSDTGIIITGMALGEPEWEQSIWVQKLDSIGCDTAGCDPTVGIVQLESKPEINDPAVIYPNPASDRVNIRFSEGETFGHKELKIEIISIFGVKVKEINVPPVSEYTLYIQDLASGVYLVNVLREGKLVQSNKLMLTR